MNFNRHRILFWCLFAIQMMGGMIILWAGLPVYWRLLGGHEGNASLNDLLVAGTTVIGMQLAYWLAYPLHRDLRLRQNVVMGHLLLWFGELTYFFPHALAVVVLFDRFKELEETTFAPERILLLVSILFAVYCFKHQLETLGEAMIESEPMDHATPEKPDAARLE